MGKDIPSHVAIILDGNGRWAKRRMLPRKLGHRQGAKNVENICESIYNMGVKYLTVYAFSTENWKRSEEEVNDLMDLLKKYLENYREKAMKNNMKIRIIGDVSKLREDIQKSIAAVESLTANNTGLNFNIAINYGGRDEIIRAIRKVCEDVDEHNLDYKKLGEVEFSRYLDTKDIPDPELIIRTSGEQRISNFLIWQNSYAEFYFTDVLWPDFDEPELKKALDYYKDRDRRFGGR